MLLRHPEELSHQLGPITKVLLDQLGAHHPQEGSRGLIGYGLGKQRLTWDRMILCYIYIQYESTL